MPTNYKKMYKSNKAAYLKLARKPKVSRPEYITVYAKNKRKRALTHRAQMFDLFGKIKWLKMPYYESFPNLQAPATGNTGNYIFALNGLYDPNVTGLGHQPLGFDQAMLLYDHYTVVSVKAIVDIVSKFSSTDKTSMMVGLYMSDDGVSTSSASQLIENGRIVYKRLDRENTKTSLTMNCNMNKFFGRSILNEDDYRGSVNANPTELVYLHVCAWNESGDATAYDCAFNIRLEYTVKFGEPKKLAQS